LEQMRGLTADQVVTHFMDGKAMTQLMEVLVPTQWSVVLVTIRSK
jgi:hypothetical protein